MTPELTFLRTATSQETGRSVVAQGVAGRPRSGLHLVDHEQGVVAEAEVLHGQQEFARADGGRPPRTEWARR